nr:MAG TPA: hypothetical protein [Caudoviricetes sp.]
MPKKFTNVIDRGRVTANKYNLTNNGDGTAIITDIESNINVPGTPLNKELFNPMQEGLIFTVETVHTIENSTDVYELEIDGLQGTSNLNGMPLFKGLSFNIKISETNTTNVVKIKISGNKYDLAKESGDTVVNLTVGELKRNRYYKVIFDSVRFTIPVEIIEYNPMFGANFGGLLGTPGTKKVGVAYYDVANNQTVVPTVENSLTYFESSKFIPISDYQTAKKLENLFRITEYKNLSLSNVNNGTANGYTIGNIAFFHFHDVSPVNSNGRNIICKLPVPPLLAFEGTAVIIQNNLRAERFSVNKNGEVQIVGDGTIQANLKYSFSFSFPFSV